jgi:nucleoside-diphosphate-sugar epimerase
MDDVASYVVAALEHEESVGSVLTIGGPQPLSWHDVVASFERELQRSLSVRMLSAQDASAVMPTFVIDLLSALDTYDSPLDMDEMRLTYAVEPTSLADYVRTFVQSCIGGGDGREASS